jgi:hypothetical protein
MHGKVDNNDVRLLHSVSPETVGQTLGLMDFLYADILEQLPGSL